MIGTRRLVALATLAVAATLMSARVEYQPVMAQAPPQDKSSGAIPSSPSGQDETPGMHHQGGTMGMGDMSQSDHDVVRLSGREWSIFNHRAAGSFLLFWGLTALVAGLLGPRQTWWRYVPPLFLLGLAEFLFLRHDPEAWPNGSIGLWASLKDPEVFQHLVFVLLLLLMAIVELLRAGDRLPPIFAKYSLPALAVTGGIYLFFHKHGGAEMEQMMSHMPDPASASSQSMKSMMASMNLIKHQHLWFSVFGFGLAVAKLLADTGRLKGRLGATLWTLFAILLGVYMMGYSE